MPSINYCIVVFLVVLEGSLSDENDSRPPCPKPKPIAHGITDWEGGSSKARFACFQGYHLVGPPQMECRYGTWYSTYPTCKPIVCNQPTIPHGRLETGDSIRYRVGQKATVVCDEGYEIRGRLGGVGAKLECKEDGSWESPVSSKHSKQFPFCKEKSCSHPDITSPTIANGTLEINGKRQGGLQGDLYQPGSVVIYSCRNGFVLLPLSAGKRVCRKGFWEGQLPACLPQTEPTQAKTHCPAPPSIANGYALTDRNSETPLALPVFSRDTHYERGTIARYHCKDGYTIRRLHGQVIYRCASTGEWSPKVPPVCIKTEQNTYHDPFDQVMCPSHNQIPHTDFERVDGWLTSNGAVHGTVLEYSCQVGYRDLNTPCLPTRRTCHAGKWVGNMPSCVPFEFCDPPPPVSHGFMATPPENAYTILSEVRYQCHPGYRMKSISTLKCHSTGCWTPLELPQCIREDIYRSKWSNSGDSDVPLVAILTTVTVGCAVIAIAIATVCIVILCRRKGGHLPPPAGPAHWSTTVTVTPECRSQLRNGSNQRNGNGFSSRFTSGATELHRQITIPSQHMNGNGHQNGNGHVAQLNRRENQPDRMTMIAIADGNQAPLPSYEEALRETNTTAATTETSGTTTNAVGNGAMQGGSQIDNRSYRNSELNGTMNSGEIDAMNGSNIHQQLQGLVTNGEISNLHALNQRDVMDQRQAVQLPIMQSSNDNIDMDDTPTSENSHSLGERSSMSPLQMYEVQRQQLSDMAAPAISNGCILSTNISQERTEINGLLHHSSALNGSNKTSYERNQEILINPEGNIIQNYSSDVPPKPPTRNHSNISRTLRNSDYNGAASNRNGGKSSSRGYSSRGQTEDPLMETVNSELPRTGYIDGDQLVVSLPQTWKQQQQHRRGNQRRSAGGKNNRHRASSSSSSSRRGNNSSYTTIIGNNLEGHAETADSIASNNSHSWNNVNNHLNGSNGRPHTLVGQSGQPGSATASLRSRQSTQSGGSNGSGDGGWTSHQVSIGSDNISSITSTTIGSASSASGAGGNGVENCSTSTHSAGSSGQTPSCKALAGSLTSFDNTLVVNAEGIPLLEENEMENEGSNSSEPADTASATCSEGSSK